MEILDKFGKHILIENDQLKRTKLTKEQYIVVQTFVAPVFMRKFSFCYMNLVDILGT